MNRDAVWSGAAWGGWRCRGAGRGGTAGEIDHHRHRCPRAGPHQLCSGTFDSWNSRLMRDRGSLQRVAVSCDPGGCAELAPLLAAIDRRMQAAAGWPPADGGRAPPLPRVCTAAIAPMRQCPVRRCAPSGPGGGIDDGGAEGGGINGGSESGIGGGSEKRSEVHQRYQVTFSAPEAGVEAGKPTIGCHLDQVRGSEKRAEKRPVSPASSSGFLCLCLRYHRLKPVRFPSTTGTASAGPPRSSTSTPSKAGRTTAAAPSGPAPHR